jgi:hypothetical protein
MLFCDEFGIEEAHEPLPRGKQIALTLWPVSSRPLKKTISSLSSAQLSDSDYLKTISVLAVFSFLPKGADRSSDISFEFPIDRFRSSFTPDSFMNAINLPNNLGFCYALTGTEASILSRARCLSFSSVIGDRKFTGKSIAKCQPLFDLFPNLSAFSLRFPVRPPPFTRTTYAPFRGQLQKFTEIGFATSLHWQKADKLERWKTHLSECADRIFIGSDFVGSKADLLRKNGITHIVNCVAQLVESPPGFISLQIPMNDGGDEHLLSHVFRTTVFIQKALESQGKVLIHGVEGASRSVAV